MAAVLYVYIVFSYVSLLILYKFKNFECCTSTQLLMLLVMPFFMQWAIGGFEASSGVAIWAILSPIGALMILGARQSTAWFTLFALLAGLSWKFNCLFSINVLPIPVHVKDTFFDAHHGCRLYFVRNDALFSVAKITHSSRVSD